MELDGLDGLDGFWLIYMGGKFGVEMRCDVGLYTPPLSTPPSPPLPCMR